MKNAFELIEYNGIPYPEGYVSKIKEVAGHLDKEEIEQSECYSLHTEYSYGKRKLDTEPLITHTYPLEKIAEAYELFENKRDGVIKVAVEC